MTQLVKINEPSPSPLAAAASVEQNIDNKVAVLGVNTFTRVCFVFKYVKYFVYSIVKMNDVASK